MKFYTFATILVAAAVFAATKARCEELDIGIGRSAENQLRIRMIDEQSFVPIRDTGLLTQVGETFRGVDPGFDANFAEESEFDYYQIDSAADIYLVAVEDMSPAFSVVSGASKILKAGDEIGLGSGLLHKHVRFLVDGALDEFDPVRLTWSGVFKLIDRGSTGYSETEPFELYLAIVECGRGDVNTDGSIDFNDIDGFVAALIDPLGTEEAARCAADVNRDGYVTFDDIDPLVELLIG